MYYFILQDKYYQSSNLPFLLTTNTTIVTHIHFPYAPKGKPCKYGVYYQNSKDIRDNLVEICLLDLFEDDVYELEQEEDIRNDCKV